MICRIHRALIIAACLSGVLSLASTAFGALIDQTLQSSGTSSEWNDAIWGGATPSIGNTYRTAAGLDSSNDSKVGVSLTGRVRAYAGSNGNPAFAGDSLEVIGSTELLIKDTAAVYNADIILNGGVVRLAPNSAGNATLNGTINITAESYLGVVQTGASALTVNSSFSGSSLLHLAAGDGSSNTLIFNGDLSAFTGTFEIGGGNTAITVDFNQNYDLPNMDVVMGSSGTSDSFILDQDLKFSSFTFNTNSLATGTVYAAPDLNALFGNGSQFGGSGTLSVYNTPLPPPATNPPVTNVTAEVNVVIIGDSTVMTYAIGDKRGWGQEIHAYFENTVGFDNRALSGRSSKTFITEGHWAAALATLETNDYVLIQFGHNDSHDPANPESTDADGDYQTYLQQYIDETQAAGAIPILVTPMHRRSFDAEGNLLPYYLDGTNHLGNLEPYASSMQQVAFANDVTCIDLFTMSGELMQQIGDAACAELLVSSDITHWNEKGAISMASLVSRGIAAADEDLKDYIQPGTVPSEFLPGSTAGALDCPLVADSPFASGNFPIVESALAATVVYSSSDAKVVEIAAGLFAEDVERVSGALPATATSVSGLTGPLVLIGTIGKSPDIDALITDGLVDVSLVEGGWEQYHIEVVDDPYPGVPQALVIAGSDRRGTAYGAFSLSEAMGVSPWYWWADSETPGMSEIHVSATPFSSRTPSVRYRGIFINDEDWGLQEWAEKNFESGPGEVKDLGPKSYAKIFELLLRMKANYCWPGMHPSTDAFNSYADNKVVANNYAIVMGSSHAEPMLRNNVFEWYNDTDPVTGQPYSNGSWDYSVNQAGVYRYWEQRAIANGAYENVFTVGKRGIHDSGMVEGSSTADKAAWLNTIFADQRTILTDHVNPDINQVAQIFVPYKEVLDIYDSGLVNVPNDVTMGWPDDNHGYIRRLSDPVEQLRSGGGGVYYHISYWGSPADYLWICSTPPSLIWEELTKAYAYNCGRVWVINVGDIKPAEICLEFAMRLAWDVNRYDENAQTTWLTEWATREFGPEQAADIVDVLNDYYQLGYERKPEHMNWVDSDNLTPSGPYPLFSHVHYGDEAGSRLAEYADLAQRANTIYASLPASQQSDFYETVLYPALGADGMNRKFINAGKAYIASLQGRNTVATRKTASQDGYDDIQTETANYNSIEGGKWNEMMDAKPRGLSVFNMPALPSNPSLTTGTLGVAVEGRMEPAYVSSSGVTYQSLPGYISLNAVTDYTTLTAPMIVTNINGKLATWTAGSDGIAYAPGAGGKAVYTFNVSEAGTYTLSFEINCPSVTDDSWHIQMDGGSAVVWNNLSNGGVWGWATFGNFTLSTGSHTLTVHQREDGAAMANIKLSSSATVLVEDRLQDSFMLPEFNARTRKSHFIDLFNTGTGSVGWQITPNDSWLQVTQSSGTLSSEQRVWISVDWASAPQGESVASSLMVESAGQSLVIPVDLWNPAAQLPLTVDFVEDNGVVAIEAENYSALVPSADATWSQVSNLGSGDGVMMVSPVTAASRTDASDIMNTSPVLEYNTYVRSSGTVSVNARFIPTLAINGATALRYAASFDDETPQIVDMDRASGSGSVWSRSVLRSQIDYTTSHTLASPGAHTLKIWMVDPGVVLDRIEIETASLPYTYRGAPETAISNYGAYSIWGGQSVVVSTNEWFAFDSVTNNGTLTLLGSALLDVGGPFINYGVLDIMTWQDSLPAGFINYGTVLDSSDLVIDNVTITGSLLGIELQGYVGHGYQLQERDSGSLMSGHWVDSGFPVDGANSPINFQVEVQSVTQGFFRVKVAP